MSDFAQTSHRRHDDLFVGILAKLQGIVERLFIGDPLLHEELVLIRNSFLFDSAWYRERYPASRRYVGGVHLHYLKRGWKIGCSPGPNFDGPEYLRNNPDVAAANEYNPLLHFIRHGAAEGREIALSQKPADTCHVAITSPDDWAEVDVRPIITIRSTLDAAAQVDYFDVSAFFANPVEAQPEASIRIDLKPVASNTCRCPVHLDEKPYVVRLTCQDHVLLHGVKVNSYYRLAKDFSAFRTTQRAIFKMQLEAVENHCRTMMITPRFVVFLEGSETRAAKATLRSLEAQAYRNWVLRQRSDEGRMAPGDWLVFLHAGDELESDLLYRYACRINSDTRCDLIYCDSCQPEQYGVRGQFYKPGWSPDYLEAFNYIGRGAAFRAVDKDLVSVSSSYADFVLRYTEQDVSVAHIPHVLIGMGFSPSAGFMAEGHNARKALEGRLARTNRRGDVVALPCAPSFFRIKARPQRYPMVSVVIPTAGKTVDVDGRRIDLILNVIDGIRGDDYPNYEIIVVHNGDLAPEQLDAMAKAGVRCIHYREQEFNISKKLNLGAAYATGELLLLMNDDIEPRSPSWISSMAFHFEKAHAGIVGVKLLYPDGCVQHIGVVQNYGDCDHVSRGLGADEFGYFGSASVVRNYSAVTGACVMVRAKTFRDVGGFNESLAISYNDVDFCFKVRALGLSVICDASIELYHFESRSRVPQVNMDELTTFYKTWSRDLTADAFYNERMLDLCPPSFSLHTKARML